MSLTKDNRSICNHCDWNEIKSTKDWKKIKVLWNKWIYEESIWMKWKWPDWKIDPCNLVCSFDWIVYVIFIFTILSLFFLLHCELQWLYYKHKQIIIPVQEFLKDFRFYFELWIIIIFIYISQNYVLWIFWKILV